ncbi:hypothetical protein BJX65DRAFT_136552 [Aspergillus insuetus]
MSRSCLCQPTIFSSLESGLSEALLLQGSRADDQTSVIRHGDLKLVKFKEGSLYIPKCCSLDVLVTSVATLATTLRSALPLSVSATTASNLDTSPAAARGRVPPRVRRCYSIRRVWCSCCRSRGDYWRC